MLTTLSFSVHVKLFYRIVFVSYEYDYNDKDSVEYRRVLSFLADRT